MLALIAPALLPLPSAIRPTPSASAPSASAGPTVVAGVGSRGSKVVIIQRVVHASAEEVYGPKTAAAVKVWQRSHSLPATGVVDSSVDHDMTCPSSNTSAVLSTYFHKY